MTPWNNFNPMRLIEWPLYNEVEHKSTEKKMVLLRQQN